MKEKIIQLFKEYKILDIEKIKEKLYIEDSKSFVDLIKNIEELTRKKLIIQIKNEKFIYTAESLNLVGTIKVNTNGFAFVYCDELLGEVYIPKNFLNSSMTDDKVEIKIDNFYSGDKNLEGKVVNILERNTKYTVGTLIKAKLFSYVKSDDKNINKYIKIKDNNIKNLDEGSKVLVEITNYSKENIDEHQGLIIKYIGHKDEPGIDILSTVYKHQIPVDFPVEINEELDKIKDDVELDNKYIDCRDELVVTIDGEDSKDLDDAISVKKISKGYKLKVFIADVSKYVTEESFLDKEAQNRGCSVYLLDRVIPMLPRKLSNGICSLNPNVDRYTICCEIIFNDNADVENYDIYPALINSKGRLTYNKVNETYENIEDSLLEYKKYISMLNVALELSKKIRNNREKRGAIDFDKAESKIIVDEMGKVQDVILRERGQAEKMIEDFMLSANEVIAEHFYWLETPFIYRIHEEPKIEKLRQFFDLATSFGYREKKLNIKEIEPYVLANMLEKFRGKNVEQMLSTILLRTMNQARYSSINTGHFALSAKYYTHFTSPIRRYPDLLVHRMIRSYIFNGDISSNNKEHFEKILPELAQKSSLCEKRAVDCEREVERIKKCEYMLNHQDQVYDGIISSVTRFGVFVTLANMIEGLCHIKSLASDYFEFDEKNIMLIGRRTSKIYRIGDRVGVKVENVDLENQNIDFKIIRHTEFYKKKKKNIKTKTKIKTKRKRT
ncbi:ribonuclease R [Gemella sp. zg-1178]|uniref:ribonuclease R n=1 Tax=Gemella sp. zg-1178 TaxID=2840372 RepID=UPI001C04178A|nr:ribonuclease R [Gemella sp. zg-1178]MBU0278907.1 ribonuclease R [Gemella sp. zg-1178]